MPRTKPVMMRPFDSLSSIANSSAMLTGLFTSGSARPMIAILALAWCAAIRFAGDQVRRRHHAVGGLMMLVDARCTSKPSFSA